MNAQANLFDDDPEKWKDSQGRIYWFDGPTYIRWRDGKRLSTQLDKVREWAMEWTWNEYKYRSGGAISWRWFTTEECTKGAGYPIASMASVNAKLRDLRKPRFGKFIVPSRFRYKGLWEYLVIPHQLDRIAIEAGFDQIQKQG